MTVHEKIDAAGGAADGVEMHRVNGITTNADLSSGPYVIDGCDTLPKLFAKRCAELRTKTAHREKDFGIWLSYYMGRVLGTYETIGLALALAGS